MLQTKIFHLIFQRAIHTTPLKNDIGKTMNKILKQPKKTRKVFFEAPTAVPKSKSFEKTYQVTKAQVNKRRINVLNKLFMRHITDLMATDEMSSTYAGLGLEINYVEVAPDFQSVNVFWVAKNCNAQVDIEKMLKESSKKLRHELSVLRVIGNVPNINFIKDKIYSQMIEIDNRLGKADFGEDYEPSQTIQQIRKELLIDVKCNVKIRENSVNIEEDLYTNENIPEMPQNVLGLNHKEIVDRIKASLKKSHFKTNVSDTNSLSYEINVQPVEYSSMKTQREAFKEFLTERQILKRKLRMEKSKISPDMEYLKEEYIKLKETEWDDSQFNESSEDKDFIEEEYDYRIK